MIDTRELRIGNIVFDKEFNIEIQFKSFHGLCNIEANPSNYEPIPLTEQWLIDFGFKNINESLGVFEIDLSGLVNSSYDPKLLYIRNYKEISIGCEGDFHYSIDIKAEYVHQLQNLYYALTGKELTKQ